MTTKLQQLVTQYDNLSRERAGVLKLVREQVAPILEAHHQQPCIRYQDQLMDIDFTMSESIGVIAFSVYDPDRGQTDHYDIDAETLFAEDPIETIKIAHAQRAFDQACQERGLGSKTRQKHLDRIRELEAEIAMLVVETW